MTRNYLEMLKARRAAGKRVCVGLDPDIRKLGLSDNDSSESKAQAQFEICRRTVLETGEIAMVFKPNFAFFAETGGYGRLRELMGLIRHRFPDVPIILDIKRGDVGPTSQAYAGEAYNLYRADAVTVNPYMGYDAIAPFVQDPNKFAYVLCKTSNPSSTEVQDCIMDVNHADIDEFGHDRARQYEYVAWLAANRWSLPNNNIGLVVGATFPAQLAEVRSIVGDDMELLVPGVGGQGGKAEDAVFNGGSAIAVNSSSGIMFADNIQEAALRLEAELLAAESSLV